LFEPPLWTPFSLASLWLEKRIDLLFRAGRLLTLAPLSLSVSLLFGITLAPVSYFRFLLDCVDVRRMPYLRSRPILLFLVLLFLLVDGIAHDTGLISRLRLSYEQGPAFLLTPILASFLGFPLRP